jgi:N-acetylglucosamine-6-sulfatase
MTAMGQARLVSATLGALAAVTLGLAAPVGAAGQKADRPNVVVVMTDDVTYDQLHEMPNFQRMERMGTSFTNAFASYPLCCPVRATFLTGQYAHNHGVKSNFFSTGGGFDSFENQDDALPVWLQDAGYRTGFVGKYLNEYGGRDPQLIPPGWDDWNGLVDYSTYNYFNYAINRNGELDYYGDRDYVDRLIEQARGTATDQFDTPMEALAQSIDTYDPIEDIGSEDQADYQPDVTGRIADESLRGLASGEDPFFLYYAPISAHRETDYEEFGGIRDLGLEFDPRKPARYEHTYDDVKAPRDPSFNEADVSDKPKTVDGRRALTEDDIETIDRTHQGALAAGSTPSRPRASSRTRSSSTRPTRASCRASTGSTTTSTSPTSPRSTSRSL